MEKLFWLSDTDWAAIEPIIPTIYTGRRRIDDRRILSGIVHRHLAHIQWRALPGVYGSYMTVYNRFNRWRKRGLWRRIEQALVERSVLPRDPTASVARIDIEGMAPVGVPACFLPLDFLEPQPVACFYRCAMMAGSSTRF